MLYLKQRIHILVENRKSIFTALIVLTGGDIGLAISILSNIAINPVFFIKIFALTGGIILLYYLLISYIKLNKSLQFCLKIMKEKE